MKLKNLIFFTIFFLGTMPLLLMVSINLRDHIKRHEKSEEISVIKNASLLQEALHARINQVRNDLSQLALLSEVSHAFNNQGSVEEINNLTGIIQNWFGKTWKASELAVSDINGSIVLHFLSQNDTLTATNNLQVTETESILKSNPQHEMSDIFSITLAREKESANQFSPLNLIVSKKITGRNLDGQIDVVIPAASFLTSASSFIWYPGDQKLYQVTPPANNENSNLLNPGSSLEKFKERFLRFKGETPIIFKISDTHKISWLPLILNSNMSPDLWIGQDIDTGQSDKWKNSLIFNIFFVVLATMSLVFFIAHLIAGKIDKIRQEIIHGLEKVLNKEEEISFNWTGPKEIKELGNDLSALSKSYIKTRQASRNAAKEAKIRQQQLVQADKMRSLGMLVSGVAHEINNPNSITLLNSPMLAKSWQDISPILENHYEQYGEFMLSGIEYSEMRHQIPRLFKELKESAVRIKNIVKDLKDYARQDISNLMEPVDVNEVVDTAVRLTNNQINKSTSKFTINLQTVPTVLGSKQKIEQVVINLIQNACESLTSKDAAIIISTYFSEKQGDVCLMVEDEGAGMEEDVLNQITDPFYTTKRALGGTGLGLSVSAAIIKEHGGTLSFSSKPKKGTIAKVCIPKANAQTQ